MDKEKMLLKIEESGLVAVVRASSADQARRMAEACMEGGVAALEITFTVQGAHKVIEELATTYQNGEILLGAGTVLDPETCRVAMLSGAQYIVTPALNPEVVRMCNRYRIPCMPGAMSIREIIEALELGADIIKLFPGDAFGPKMISAIAGPLPQAKLMPTGGVSVSNVAEWIKAGAVAVGVGGQLTAGAKTGDYAAITRTAKEFIAQIKLARGV